MKLPYQYKGLVYIAALVIVLPWLAWSFAVRDTVGAWLDCRHLDTQLAKMPLQAASVSSPVGDRSTDLVLSGHLLDVVRQGATGIAIAGYEPHVTLQQDGIRIHTARMTLSGDFAALLQVVNRLEDSLPHCRLSSLGWQSSTDRRSGKTQLTLIIYIEQIIKS